MSKRAYISRYLALIKIIKSKPYSTFEEINHFIDTKFDFLRLQDDTLEMGFSKRTFQRDLKEIRTLFGIEIQYSKKDKGYFLVENNFDDMNFQRMLEAFNLFNSLQISHDMSSFIHLENRKPQGTENLYGLLHAIKNTLQIRYEYNKFWEEEGQEQRHADSYALKEFKNRWYLIALDHKDKKIKTFALERISDLEITDRKFDYPPSFNVEENYTYSFGIVSPNAEAPEKIILSFTPLQGRYVKSLPLHASQQIILENEQELQVQLTLFVTHDFVMELLSFGDQVKVLKPKSLVSEMKRLHKDAYEKYE